MGIRFLCPACRKRINVKEYQAGKRGFCPKCGAPVMIPLVSEIPANPRQDDDSAGRLTSTAQAAPPQTAAILGGQHSSAVPSHQPGGVPVGRIVAMAGPTVDPLVEAPGAVWYVSSEGHSQPFGPADSATMGQWLHEGRVGATSLVWRQDWPEWRQAATVWPQLAGAIAGVPAVAGPPVLSAASNPALVGKPPVAPEDLAGRAPGQNPVSTAAPGPGIYYQRRASNSYAITVVVLVLLVAVLAAVMYWVLTRDLGSAAPAKAALVEPGTNNFGTALFFKTVEIERNRI